MIWSEFHTVFLRDPPPAHTALLHCDDLVEASTRFAGEGIGYHQPAVAEVCASALLFQHVHWHAEFTGDNRVAVSVINPILPTVEVLGSLIENNVILSAQGVRP
ncbi:MAG: hypothetical protein H0X73_13705 [Chthoniobacterales bacterium]|nr:hypothetical protein [Chthoniobacterales bacterium]